MKKTRIILKDDLNVDINVYIWEPENQPKAIIHFLHGMQEHGERYELVAKNFTERRILCIADDHHGHGESVSNPSYLGIIPGTYKDIVNAIHLVTIKVKEKFPNIPVFLLGHSWGSFLSQYYIQHWGHELDGCILSATTGRQPIIRIAKVIAKVISLFKGKDKPAKFLHNLVFGSYNNNFKPTRTNVDWLTRDIDIIDKYIVDPKSGFICSNKFYVQMTNLFIDIWNKQNENKIPKELPILFIAGTLDPLSEQTKGTIKLMKRYQKLGLSKLTHKLYPDGRHEILNEINRDEVYEDIISWIEKLL